MERGASDEFMPNHLERHFWYCIRTLPKHESIAGIHLRQSLGLDVFCPKLRFKKATRRGAVWFVEALFPGYIFSRFDWNTSAQSVAGTPGVCRLVTFGDVVPVVPLEVIDLLQREFDDSGTRVVHEAIGVGDDVEIAGGPFHGFKGTVLRGMSGTGRVQVLVEMLGGLNRVDIGGKNVAHAASAAQRVRFSAAPHKAA